MRFSYSKFIIKEIFLFVWSKVNINMRYRYATIHNPLCSAHFFELCSRGVRWVGRERERERRYSIGEEHGI